MESLKIVPILCLLSLAFAGVRADTQVLEDDDDSYVEWLEAWKEAMSEIDEKPELQAEWQRRHQEQRSRDEEESGMPPFECPPLSHPQPATSVHALQPNDISVVAAFGDSITAGNGLGAPTAVHVLLENRGESWSVGSEGTWQDGVFTVPNFLKEYNPNIQGGSKCSVDRDHPHSNLNRARPGNTNRDMPRQAREMVEKVNASDVMDLDNDWKLITMFIGGNDLCGYCKDHGQDRYAPEVYLKNVKEALDYLQEHMPRTLVNVVPMFDVSPLTNMSTGLLCNILHRAFCICAVNETTREELRDVQLEYYRLVDELVESRVYDVDDSFTVVMQPHLVDVGPVVDPETGDWDTSMFAPDCFHLNRIGHQGMAYMLWNVMYIPVGQKPLEYDLLEEPEYVCPSEDHPYIFTNNNSDVINWKKLTSKRTIQVKDQDELDYPLDLVAAPLVMQDAKAEPVQHQQTPENHTNQSEKRKGIIAAFVACVGCVIAVALLLGVLIPQYKLWKAKKRLANEPASFENPVYFDISES